MRYTIDPLSETCTRKSTLKKGRKLRLRKRGSLWNVVPVDYRLTTSGLAGLGE